MATRSSTKNGDWHDPTVWSGGAVPVLGDTFAITHNIVISQSMSVGVPNVKNSVYGGSLRANPTMVGTIEIAGSVEMVSSAQISFGTAAAPVTGSVDVSIYGSVGQALIWHGGNGLISLVGNIARDRCSRVVGGAAAGATSFQVSKAGGWQVGDRIVISEGSSAFGIDTAVTSVVGTTIGVPPLAAAIVDTAPIVNLTSNVRLRTGPTNALQKLLVNQYTNSVVYVENAILDASYSTVLLAQTWDRMLSFSTNTTLRKCAIVNEQATAVGGAQLSGMVRDVAFFSRRTENSTLTIVDDLDADGVTVISQKARSGTETVDCASGFGTSVVFGASIKNLDVAGSNKPVIGLVCGAADISDVRAFCWGTDSSTARLKPQGGRIKNLDLRQPGSATLGQLQIYDGRQDVVVENLQGTYLGTTPTGNGGSWATHATGAESARGRISTPIAGMPAGTTGALRVVGTATAIPVIANPDTASLSGKILLWVYRDAGTNQVITVSGSSVAPSVTVPAGTQAWHKIEMAVAANDTLSITSIGVAPYWVHGCKLQKAGAYGSFYGYTNLGTVQIVDPRIVLTEAAALALPVAVNHTTQTVTVSGAVTANQLWHALTADIATIANLGRTPHFTLAGDGSVTTSYSLAFGASGSIDGAVTASNGKTSTLRVLNLDAANVLVLDGNGDVFGSYVGVSGTHKVLLPFAAAGTWTWVVKRAGYEHARGTFTPSLGGVTDVNPSTPQKLTPEGQPMFTAAPSALVTVNIGNEAEVSIGDGMASLQGTFDATEIALMTVNGMRWIAGGGDDCSIFNSAGGDYLFLTAGWRLKRDSIVSSNAGVNAFVVSTEGVPVDESNGPVRFLTSDATTSIAAAVRAALAPDLAALALQVWQQSLTGQQTAGSTGAALQDASARVAASL